MGALQSLSSSARFQPTPARTQQANNPNRPSKILSTGQRIGDIVGLPLWASLAGLGGAVKGLGVTTLASVGLAKTNHPVMAAIAGVLGLAITPVYATAKAVGSLFSNLKAGITGHSSNKK